VNQILERLRVALASSYRLDRELGAGGMATVYLAHDLKHERDVAIKVLHPDLGASLGAERFLGEIKTTAKLQHPHILPLLDSGAADGLLYYVMPYVRGETLRARLQREKQLPIDDALRIAREIALALDHAHQQGIVHRDIKPENILLSGGTAVVADFGIAKALSASVSDVAKGSLTATGSSIGTPAYMAPEQAAGDPATDHRADLYAWGLVAYELLAGKHPFARHTTAHALVTAQLTETPEPLPPTVPVSVARIVERSLVKDPAARASSAARLLRELDDADTKSADRSVATPASPTPTPAPSRFRIAARAGIVLGAAALLYAVVVGLPARSSFASLASGNAAGEDSVMPRSLAVLPFDIGADTANAYLAEGLSGEVATELSRLPGVHVRAYASSKAMRGAKVADAARELNVNALLIATLQRGGDRLRVNASLVRGDDESVIWSAHFDEREGDQFALQDKLAEAIAQALRIQLSPADRASITKRAPVSPEVYDLVQRARFMSDRYTAASLNEAVRLASLAVAKDSTYAPGWTALAEAWMMISDDYEAPVKTLPHLRAAVARANALDTSYSEAHAQTGALRYWYDRRVPDAAREFEAALALDSLNYASALSYSFLLDNNLDLPDSAYAVLHRSLRSNPFVLSVMFALINSDRLLRYVPADSARVYCERLRRLWGPFAGDRCVVARALAINDLPAARAFLNRVTLDGLNGRDLAQLAIMRARAGDTTGARRALEAAESRAGREYVNEQLVATGYFLIGDREKSIRWWQMARKSHSGGIVLALGPRFASLRTDPRFLAVIAPPDSNE
jgi:eukaryotic-like serine/threonine-protein kinase